MVASLLELTDAGLYCRAGDFYVDPWKPVPYAVITHAHSDHARAGSERYLAATTCEQPLRTRLGADIHLTTLAYGETVQHNGVVISLHPAGHVLGSAQVRIEHQGQVWVVSGDYKIEPDPTCTPFEPVRCHGFITESTFGLPIYRWSPQAAIFAEINNWWRGNQEAGDASVLYGYALGKAQRLLAGVNSTIGPIYTHGAVETMTAAYRRAGVAMPATTPAVTLPRNTDWSKALIVAPPSAHGTPWLRKFGSVSTAFASGWMRIRGTRRRRAIDHGFPLSDHCDWPGLLQAISATGAEQIWVTHGYSAVLVRWLREQGRDARVVTTQFEGETDETAVEATVATE